MKVPIPNDWDGENWECVQILWPNSPQFWGLLNGLLTLMTRGRYWEENTGSIIDMQKIAWEIFNANFPYTDCNNEPIPPPSPCDTVCFGDGGLDDCEDDMAGCVLPYGSIEVINGVLSYKTCDGWTPVKGWGTGVVVDPPTEEEPIEEEDYGCNKAAGVASLFKPDFDIAIFQMNDKLPRYRAYWLRQSLPQYSISNAAATLVATEYAKDTAGNYALLSDADLEQRLRCAWSPALLDTSTLTEDEFLAMLALTNSQFEPVQTAFVNSVVRAIGYSTFSWWAAAFFDDTADCECPAGPPEASSIFFTGDTVGPSGGSGCAVEVAEVRDGGRRFFIQLAGSAGSFRTMGQFDLVVAGAQLGDWMKVRLYLDPEQVEYMPSKEWETYTDPAPPEDWLELTIEGGGDETRVEFSNYVEFASEDAPAAAISHVRHQGARFYPSGGGVGDWRTYWYVEIVEVNGVPLTPIGP